MLSGHQLNSGNLLQNLKAFVGDELGLALVLIHPQPCLDMERQVGLHIGFFEVS